jgi:hypothetical protein
MASVSQNHAGEILVCDVTAHPTAEYAAGAAAFLAESSHLLRDRDTIYGDTFNSAMRAQIEALVTANHARARTPMPSA